MELIPYLACSRSSRPTDKGVVVAFISTTDITTTYENFRVKYYVFAVSQNMVSLACFLSPWSWHRFCKGRFLCFSISFLILLFLFLSLSVYFMPSSVLPSHLIPMILCSRCSMTSILHLGTLKPREDQPFAQFVPQLIWGGAGLQHRSVPWWACTRLGCAALLLLLLCDLPLWIMALR